MPNSARRLSVDKAQGLQSGILTITSLALHPVSVETRVKAFIIFEINLTVTIVCNTRETGDIYWHNKVLLIEKSNKD